jgi:hypothetical protein
MNLLIAIMGDSYEKVKESERVQALRERAQIIVEAELTRPSWHKYHKYMHIAEAADIASDTGMSPSLEWEGITGRVKQLLFPIKAELQEMAANQDEENSKIKTELQEVKTNQKEMAANQKEMAANQAKELAELKALLVALLDRS